MSSWCSLAWKKKVIFLNSFSEVTSGSRKYWTSKYCIVSAKGQEMIYKRSFFLTEFVPGIGTGRQLQFFQHFHHCFSSYDSSKKLRNRPFIYLSTWHSTSYSPDTCSVFKTFSAQLYALACGSSFSRKAENLSKILFFKRKDHTCLPKKLYSFFIN